MANFIPILKEKHQNKFWIKPEDFSFCKEMILVPLSFEEIKFSVLAFPLVFVKSKDILVACLLLGFEDKKNLFVNEGNWIGKYIPWLFRTYPFSLGKNEENELILLIDEGFLTDNPQKGQPIFDENGNLNDFLGQLTSFLIKRERGYAWMRELSKILEKNDLLEPWQLRVIIGEKEIDFKGLYRVNENRIYEIDEKVLKELRDTGSLPLIYGQLFSMNNLNILVQFANIFYSAEVKLSDKDKVEEKLEEPDFMSTEELQSVLEILKDMK